MNEGVKQTVEYFIQCEKFRKEYFQMMKFTNEYQIQNIWGQWMIRCLGQTQRNYHVIPKPEIVKIDRAETIKHMEL